MPLLTAGLRQPATLSRALPFAAPQWIAVAEPGGRFRVLRPGIPSPSSVGAVGQHFDLYGHPAAHFIGASSQSIPLGQLIGSDSAPITVLAVCRANSLAADRTVVARWGTAAQRGFDLEILSTGAARFDILASGRGAAFLGATPTSTIVAGQWNTLIGFSNDTQAGTGVEVNGQAFSYTQSSIAGGGSTPVAPRIGSAETTAPFDGDIALIAVWGSELPITARKALGLDPWMLVEQRRRPLFFVDVGAASGGGLSPTPMNVTYTMPLPTFTLTGLHSKVAEFVADNIAGSDGDLVQTWTDTSTAGNTATQATSGNRPTLKTGANGINGHNAVLFASGKSMVTGSFLGAGYNTAFTAFAVLKRTSGTGAQIAAGFGTGNKLTLGMTGAASAASYRSDIPPGRRATISTPDLTPVVTTLTAVPVRDETVVMSVTYDGANLMFSANGEENSQLWAGSVGTPGSSATGNLGLTGVLTLGANAAGTSNLLGLLAELHVYNFVASTATRRAEERRLRAKYAPTMARLVVVDGDSLTAGAGSTVLGGWDKQMMPLLTNAWDVDNTAVGGTSELGFIDRAIRLITPFVETDYTRRLVVHFGGGNNPSGTINTDIRDYCLARKAEGFQVIICTLTPRTTTDFASINIYIRANWTTFADALCDFAALPEFDSIADASNLTYYDPDGTHITDAGYGKLADLIAPVINGLAAPSSGGGTRRNSRWPLLLGRRLGFG